MKKMAVLAACLLVLAAIIRGISSNPSILEVRIMLADGGPEVTAQMRKYVGFVPAGRHGPPTLGNIQPIQPIVGNENVYEVPSNRSIGIFILSPGVPPFQSTVSVKSGQHLAHNVVLDAGIVRVTTEQTPNTGIPNIWLIGPDGQFDANDRFVDGAQFIVPAGEQVFQVGRYLEAKRESIDVVAGQTQHLNIVNETGTLNVNLETVIPFESLSPTPVLRAEGGSKFLHQRGNHFDAGRWQYGTYDAVVELFERFRIPIRPATTASLNVVIDRAENAMTIPLSLVGVEVHFTGWPDKVPEYTMALIVSINDPGPPFATYRVTNNRASLIFVPPKDSHDYAIAAINGTQVTALQAIGPLSADIPYRATLPRGGNMDLCDEILLDFDCGSLPE